MGGSTITVYGLKIETTLEKMKAGILSAVPTLWADSSIILFNPTTKEAHFYKVIYLGKYGERIKLREVKMGRNIGMPLSVSAHYQRKPRRNEWLGTVHLHT